jgi:ketopantoate reductase
MKISIIGCSAMGSVYASFFSANKFDVLVSDKWKIHMDKIASDGLNISGSKINKTMKDIKVSKKLRSHKNSNLIIIATRIE